METMSFLVILQFVVHALAPCFQLGRGHTLHFLFCFFENVSDELKT